MADEVGAPLEGRARQGSGNAATAVDAGKAGDDLGRSEASGSGAGGQSALAEQRDPGLEEDEEEEEEEGEEGEGVGDLAAGQEGEEQVTAEGEAAQDDEMAVPFEDDMYGEYDFFPNGIPIQDC